MKKTAQSVIKQLQAHNWSLSSLTVCDYIIAYLRKGERVIRVYQYGAEFKVDVHVYLLK